MASGPNAGGAGRGGRARRRSVRVEDVALEAGVSPITVSRALSTPAKVSRETRERVAAAVASTGYIVNSLASTLRSGRSRIVTVFVANLENPHIASILRGIIDAFHASPFSLMFAQTGWQEDVGPDTIESVLSFRPAGMAFCGVGFGKEVRRTLLNLDLPVVQIGSVTHPLDVLVQLPSFEAGRLMGEHFGRQGFARVAFCGHTMGQGVPRLEGFHAGLGAFGVAPALILPIEGTQSVSDGIASVGTVLDRLPDCDAIFYGSDLLALGALIEAKRRGREVPQQLAIAGYGDLDFASHLDPPLTTLRVSDYDVGLRAGTALLQRIAGHAGEAVLPTQVGLEIRRSTSRE
jgi:LacI family gluconate utilization system Gnt-I transcriptional repressor